SGSLLPVFEDDQTYPFRAHAPFKVWVPLTDAPDSFLWFEPGATARLIVHRCADYWHKPAQLPQDYWVRHFDVRTVAAPEGARRELPYNPIIALNAGGAVLHYQVLERQPPRERHSLLIDAGAQFQGYASDITRTYSAGDADFALLVGRMDQMQQTLCAGVRAGVDWRDVQLRAHRLLAELLREAAITRCSAEEAMASAVTSVFLPHGIGHLLGLEVHDVAGFMRSPQGGDIPRPG